MISGETKFWIQELTLRPGRISTVNDTVWNRTPLSSGEFYSKEPNFCVAIAGSKTSRPCFIWTNRNRNAAFRISHPNLVQTFKHGERVTLQAKMKWKTTWMIRMKTLLWVCGSCSISAYTHKHTEDVFHLTKDIRRDLTNFFPAVCCTNMSDSYDFIWGNAIDNWSGFCLLWWWCEWLVDSPLWRQIILDIQTMSRSLKNKDGDNATIPRTLQYMITYWAQNGHNKVAGDDNTTLPGPTSHCFLYYCYWPKPDAQQIQQIRDEYKLFLKRIQRFRR